MWFLGGRIERALGQGLEESPWAWLQGHSSERLSPAWPYSWGIHPQGQLWPWPPAPCIPPESTLQVPFIGTELSITEDAQAYSNINCLALRDSVPGFYYYIMFFRYKNLPLASTKKQDDMGERICIQKLKTCNFILVGSPWASCFTFFSLSKIEITTGCWKGQVNCRCVKNALQTVGCCRHTRH